jgi:putative ABC transport system substrate-binding protein
MRRREFVTLICGAAAAVSRPLPGLAESLPKRPLIAAQVGGSKAAADRFFGGFSQGMRELGYAEARDYGFEVRYADGNIGRIPAQMEELVRLKPDVIVAGTMAGVITAKKLTDTIPIVGVTLTDPAGFGLAASHARPGGNVTGVLVTVEDLPTKLLGLALEIVPGAKLVGLLVNPANPNRLVLRSSLEIAVKAHGIELLAVEAGAPDDLHPAMQRFARERVNVVLVLLDTMFLNERKRIALFAVAERLPTMFGFRENVEDGGLMSYGTNTRESFRRTATFVDKILKGAKAGDLPIEFPTKLELVINLMTAKALGLDVPATYSAGARPFSGMWMRCPPTATRENSGRTSCAPVPGVFRIKSLWRLHCCALTVCGFGEGANAGRDGKQLTAVCRIKSLWRIPRSRRRGTRRLRV